MQGNALGIKTVQGKAMQSDGSEYFCGDALSASAGNLTQFVKSE